MFELIEISQGIKTFCFESFIMENHFKLSIIIP
jgi:hypothetical protein